MSRDWCTNCRKAKVVCYCGQLRPFESSPRFVILAHPRELRNSVGTGRMLHLSVRNSILIDGHDFSQDSQVNSLIQDSSLHCVLLFPGARSLNLSACTREEAGAFVPSGKQLVLFIVDGTWETARGMINRSANLRAMPQLSFTPERRSGYVFRKQPHDYCLSTIETAHWIIDKLAALGVFERPAGGALEGLLEIFGDMVKRQLQYASTPNLRRTEGQRQRSC
jgi:DTW domain-containing protein YfiP